MVSLVKCSQCGLKARMNKNNKLKVCSEKCRRNANKPKKVKRRTDSGKLAECPLCGSLDIGGAINIVNCYGCGLSISKNAPLQNAINAWNMRDGKSLD